MTDHSPKLKNAIDLCKSFLEMKVLICLSPAHSTTIYLKLYFTSHFLELSPSTLPPAAST
jgi:hypothetical protein